MKTLMLRTIAVLALSAGVAQAQDLTGSWQGTLQAGGRELRLVFKIANDAGAPKAVMYSIDQGGQGMAASAVAVQGTTVRISIAALGATFEGKLDAADGTLTGTFTQTGAPAPMPLNLKRATGDSAWTIPEPPAQLKPMAADAVPVFEVATIKPSNPDTPGKLFAVRPRNLSTLNTTLADLITFAYGVHAKQITDVPEWVASDKFDISGQPDGEGQPSQQQWKVMLQKLLAERFKLAFHRENKELAVYAITVDKSGPKLTKSADDPNGPPSMLFRGLGMLPARNASMAEFAGVLQAVVLDRPVVDQTKLAGKFDFTLTWTPDESQFGGMGGAPPTGGAASAAAPPGLTTALPEQLGLRLESTKAQVSVIVVDRVEKPQDN
jgi:uncharacterized protein (TIGR03435 family)